MAGLLRVRTTTLLVMAKEYGLYAIRGREGVLFKLRQAQSVTFPQFLSLGPQSSKVKVLEDFSPLSAGDGSGT